MSRFLPVVAFAGLLVACDDTDEIACTREARVSVVVNVADPEGVPVTDVEVTYEAEDGTRGDCETYEAGVYLCGYEVAGELVIRIERDDAYDILLVLVEADECHVISETIDVVVPPAA